MARPKEFDPDIVLDQVMDLFWERGYEGASMDDIVRASGIGRQSLYNEFGGKREIYLAALDRFAATDGGALFPLIERDGPIRKVLRELLENVIDVTIEDRDGKGCMLLNAVTTLAACDGDVKKRVCAANEAVERALVRRLDRAQRAGDLAKRHDPVALGRFFAATIIAIRTTGKTVRDRKHLASIAEVALTVLR
jgi:TetR/AcrR family transcriptional regulator, transcriptional repressor for nem operon